MNINMVICGDTLTTLKTLPDECVQMCVTSPPYWGLRDYGTASWLGGDEDCDHIANPNATKKQGNPEFLVPCRDKTKVAGYYKDTCPKCGATRIDQQLGLEKTPEEYVSNLVAVFREVRRVLKSDGTFWLVIGDSYAGSGKGGNAPEKRNPHSGGVSPNRHSNSIKPKDLVGIPWMLAFALRADGWWLRKDNIWFKDNPMPESVKDRCTSSHEYIFHFSKSAKYYYDYKAILEPLKSPAVTKRTHGKKYGSIKNNRDDRSTNYGESNPDGCNKRSVWQIPTQSYKHAHFACFPERLVGDCIKAGSKPGDIVLDTFMGACTTGFVARKLGRKYLGIELNPEYIEIGEKRMCQNEMEFG